MPDNDLQLPFLTRAMLAFGVTARFQLRLQTQSNEGGSIEVSGATRSGHFTFRQVIGSGSDQEEFTFNIPDMPIFVTVRNRTADTWRGPTFASLSLMLNGNIVLGMCSGYVYDGFDISWPMTPLREATPEWGEIIAITGTNPAAGAEISQSVPLNVTWMLRSATFTLVTDANAATRQVHFQYTDGTTVLLDIPAATTQTAGLTRVYSAAAFADIAAATADNDILIGLPHDFQLISGFRWRTVTDNILAGDNFGAPVFVVERWFNPRQ